MVRGQCFNTTAEADNMYASYCGITSTDASYIIYCYPNEFGGINFVRENLSTGATIVQSSILTYPNCEVQVGNTTELAWLVVGVWVVAWGFRKMIEVLKR